ncbi:MAG TPA: sialidase family protein [Actinophytocola sp.]|uniref:sialidase family protein n=1 Tax=Actinophytocola sp. TaxID=1872138 RepID=UPI002E04D118|nr:sialidase family protein [Actinophytocola sp.]
MNRKRSIVLSAAVTLLLSGPVVTSAPAGAAAPAPPGACGLLADAQVRQYISGPGAAALARQCDRERSGAPYAETQAPTPEGQLASAAAEKSEPGIQAVDVLVNNRATDTFPRTTQSETSTAVRSTTVLVGYNDSGQFLTSGDFSGYSRSTNSGASFTDMGPPTTPLGQISSVSGDPVMVSDFNRMATDTALFYMANLATNAAGTSIIGVHRSGNGGAAPTPWQFGRTASPLAVAGEFQDKEWLAVDNGATFPGRLYACWRRFGGANGIQFSRSTDFGLTFTQLAANLSTGTTTVQGCSVDVDRETGRVLVAWLDSSFNPPQQRAKISTNGGVSFGAEFTIGAANLAETINGACGRNVFLDTQAGNTSRAIRSTPFPTVAFRSTNASAYSVWHRAGLAGGSGADIAFARSTNNGTTFGATQRINSVVTGDQFFPSIAVNAAGTIRVFYYSTQLDATKRLLNAYFVQSADDGVTWSAPVRVTDVSFDRPITNPNFDISVAGCYMGDYNDIAAPPSGLGDNAFYMAWGDNRLDADPGPAIAPDPDIRFDK